MRSPRRGRGNRLDVAPGNQAVGLDELADGLSPPRLAEGLEVELLDFGAPAVEAEGSSKLSRLPDLDLDTESLSPAAEDLLSQKCLSMKNCLWPPSRLLRIALVKSL